MQVGKENRIESASLDILRKTGGLMAGGKAFPATTANEAAQRAVKAAAGDAGTDALGVSDGPALLIYAPDVIGESGPAVLAYSMIVESVEPGVYREQFLLNAQTGEVAFHYTLIETAKNRQIFDSNNTSADPGTLARGEGGPVSGVNEVNLAYQYFGDTYDFYFSNHGRDSIDGAGVTMRRATVRFCDPSDVCPFANAYWDGTRMSFGDGFAAADDVVGHELTHGVTQYTSGLIYANQSGALNESFSDVWGELIDQSNSGGTDTPAVKWQMGEDVPGFGAIRNMKDPTSFGDPDSTCSPNWYTGPADGGGVRTNSGVNNKLAFLLTDGQTFNSHTVTGMGIPIVADLYYEVQTNLLTAGASYLDLYHALTQAADRLGPQPRAAGQHRAGVPGGVDHRRHQLSPAAAPPPANDDCANAIAVTLDQDYTGDITAATGTESLFCGSNLNDTNDAWYTFAPSATGLYTVTLCSGTSADSTLGIYTGSCASHVNIACDDDGCGNLGGPSRIVQNLQPGHHLPHPHRRILQLRRHLHPRRTQRRRRRGRGRRRRRADRLQRHHRRHTRRVLAALEPHLRNWDRP